MLAPFAISLSPRYAANYPDAAAGRNDAVNEDGHSFRSVLSETDARSSSPDAPASYAGERNRTDHSTTNSDGRTINESSNKQANRQKVADGSSVGQSATVKTGARRLDHSSFTLNPALPSGRGLPRAALGQKDAKDGSQPESGAATASGADGADLAGVTMGMTASDGGVNQPPTQNRLPADATTASGGLASTLPPSSGWGASKNLTGAAFALHITPGSAQMSAGAASDEEGDSSSAAGGLAFNGLGAASNSLSNAPLNSAGAEPARAQPPSGQGFSASSLLTVPTSALPATASSTGGAPQTSSAATVSSAVEVEDTAADNPSGVTQTVRTVKVQLTGADGEGRVDLRLVERAGGLSVSVRASDSALTKGLQENLPELSARLAADKYQTHVFLPPANAQAAPSSSANSSGQPSGQGQDPGGRSFSFSGDSGGRQKNGQGDRQAADQEAAGWRQLAALGRLSSAVSPSVSVSASDPPPATLAATVANQ